MGTIQTLYVLVGVTERHVVLIAMAIYHVGFYFDKFHIHGVVDTGSETVEIRTGANHGTFLAIVIEADVVRVVSPATRHVDVVILTNACFKCFIEPIGVNLGRINIFWTCRIVSGRYIHTTIVVCHSDVFTILVRIHHIVHTLLHLVKTGVSGVVYFHGLVLLSLLGRDDNHAVGSTRTVDGGGRSVLEYLKGFNIIRRKVANGCSHGNSINNVQRCRTAKRADTTDTYCRVGSRLSVRCNLNTRYLTFEHRGDVGVRYFFHFFSVDNSNGACEVNLALSSVTNYHHLFEFFYIRSQRDGTDICFSSYEYLLG